MSASRCPNCDAPLTTTEAAGEACPDCATPLADSLPFAPAVDDPLPTPRPRRSRWTFPAGLAVGILLALTGATGAWWAWGPAPFPVDGVTPAAAQPVAEIPSPPADEVTRQAELLQRARAAAERAEALRVETEKAVTSARERLQTALGEVAAAEAERSAAEERLRAVHGKEAEAGVVKARAAAQQADIQRVVAERALADVQARLHAAKAKEDQARQSEAAARTARTDAERALADARNKLQTTRDQHAEADRQLAAIRGRLQAAKDQAAAADRELAQKKTRLADLDRAILAKAAKTAAGSPTPDTGTKPAGGFVRDWLVVGPFPAPDRKGHDIAFPPEAEPVDPKKEYKAATGTLRWQHHGSPADYIDFEKLFKTQDPAVAYAVCWVRPDRPRRISLNLGSNDGIKVWVGGKVIADRAVSRSAAPGQDRASCELAAGWNEVRVKIDNQGGPWGFYFDVRDAATDRPPSGLEFTATPPEPKGKK